MGFATCALARGPMGARDVDMQTAVTQAHQRYVAERTGKNLASVPALASVSSDLFAVVVVRVDGRVFEAGDAQAPLVLSAVATPFTAALVAEQRGADVMTSTLGAIAGTAPVPDARTPQDFGSAPYTALAPRGALAMLSLVQPKGDADGKWRAVLGNLGKFAGRDLLLDERVYQSAAPLLTKAQHLARDMAEDGRLQDDAEATAELSLKQGCVGVTTRDLAVMAATLANDGVNPIDGRVVVSPEISRNTLAVMTNPASRPGKRAWIYKTGMPVMAGSSGAVIMVVPGRIGIAAYSAALDSNQVSVRGQHAINYLMQVMMITPAPAPK